MVNNKGISTILVTIIMIALVLAAVTIVWIVFSNLIESEQQDIFIAEKCLGLDLQITKAVEINAGEYNVTLTRGSGNDEEMGGLKAVFKDNMTDNSDVIDVPGNIANLATVTKTVDAGFNNAVTVEMTPYFIAESGDEKLCGQTIKLNF